MALGTVTLLEHLETLGDRKAALVTIQLTSGANYTALGESVAAGVLAATGIQRVLLLIPTQPLQGSRFVTWDSANGKLLVYTALGTEAVAATDQSAFLVQALVVGI